MSDSVQPHRRQPTRLPHPWDSPGKNTGVGCHFLLAFMKEKRESEVAQSCPTLCNPVDCSLPGSPVHGIFQARVPEWGAIAFSAILMIYNIKHNNDQVKRLLRSSYNKIACGCVLVSQSCLTLYNTMDCSHQASLSMEFSRQE